MPAGVTYESIASATVTGNQNTLTFNSIPQTYTDLILVTSSQSRVATDLLMQFNNNTATNYSWTGMYTNGTTTTTYYRSSSQTSLQTDYFGYILTSNFNINIIQINNYTNTNIFKSVLARSGNANAGTDFSVGLWQQTAAISRIDLSTFGSRYLTAGSTYSLYGITAA